MIDLDRVSFQMWSARNFPPLDAQLATLSAIGYRNVEPYGGLFDDRDALRARVDELRRARRERALRRSERHVATFARWRAYSR